MTRVSPPDRRSARAIIIEDGQVALIERKRSGDHFFVFPGGSIEPGESSSQAVVREVVEELGLMVRPSRIAAEVTFPDRVQDFWLAEIGEGEFGTGTGPEMAGREDDRDGSTQPYLDVDRRHSPSRGLSPMHRRRTLGTPRVRLAHQDLRFTDEFMWWLPD